MNRIDKLINNLEEWICNVLDKNDFPIKEVEPKEAYLNLLIDWVSSHVCKEDGNNIKWWMSHGFTEEEAKEIIF